MNREKRQNETGKKRQYCLNDFAGYSADRNHADERYKQSSSAVDVNNTEVKSRLHSQYHIPDVSGYDGYGSTRLSSVQMNAEANSVADRDLLLFRGHEADGCPSELYQRRTVSNSDDCRRHQQFSNRKKKKRTVYHLDSDRRDGAMFSSTAAPVSSADGVAGFVDRHMRSFGHSTGWQHRTDMQHSQSNTLQNELFYSDDHFLAPPPIAASVLASEKVFLLKCIVFAARCYASAAYAVMQYLSVTIVHSVKVNKHIFKIFPPSGSQTILVLVYQTYMVIFRWGPP